MTRIRVAAAVVAVLAAAVIVPVGAASAQTAVVRDAGTADTWEQTYDGEADQYVYTESGSLPNVDVKKTTVKHTASRVTVTVNYVDLVKDKTYEPTFRSWFKLSDGSGAVLTVWVDEDWKPVVYFMKAATVSQRVSRQARCVGLKARFDYAGDTLTMSIPRSCLGDPSWVRFYGMASGGARDDHGGWATAFQDNAQTASYDEDQVSQDCWRTCHGWTGKLRKG